MQLNSVREIASFLYCSSLAKFSYWQVLGQRPFHRAVQLLKILTFQLRDELLKFAFLIFMSSLLKGRRTSGNLSSTAFLGLWDITREQCTMSTAGVAAQEMRVPLKTGFLHTSQGMGSLKTCWGSHSGFEKWVRLKFDLLHLHIDVMSITNTYTSADRWFIYSEDFFFF